MTGVFAGSTGKGMGNYTEEQISKIYDRSFWQNEKFPQKLGPILFTNAKCLLIPVKQNIGGTWKVPGQEGK